MEIPCSEILPSQDLQSSWNSGIEAGQVIGTHIIVSHSSGLVEPPFVHNGFLAEVKFVILEKREKIMPEMYRDKHAETEETESTFEEENDQPSVIQQDEAVPTYIRPARVIEQVTRPSQFSQTMSMAPASTRFQCRDEVTEPHRAGLIRSSHVMQSKDTCSIVFRGEERDLVMLRIYSLHLR